MRYLSLLIILFSCLSFASDNQQIGFSGNLVLSVGEDCEDPDKAIMLRENFSYIDSNGMGWEASAGNCTDGASIPLWAQYIIGSSFNRDYLKAAVIHDHYCDRRVRPWLMTHWVFYDALLTSGVPKKKALLLYYGVLIGGPKWIRLIESQSCDATLNCVKSQKSSIDQVSHRGDIVTVDGERYLHIGETYGSAAFNQRIEEMNHRIEKEEVELSEDSIRRIALENMEAVEDIIYIEAAGEKQ